MNVLKLIYWFFRDLQSGRKVYLFCIAVACGIAYVHVKHPTWFGFSNKELLYVGLVLVWAMLNRNVQKKIHGSRVSRMM